MKKLIVLITLIMLGSSAFAHSKINTTEPENEAILSEAPETITLSFAKKIRLIKVGLTHLDDTMVELDLGDQKSFASKFILPLEQTAPGTYQIEWRGLGIDGHAMTGEFGFTVQ